MKKEFENTLAKSTLAVSVFSVLYTLIELNLVMMIIGCVFGLAGIVLGIICYINKWYYTSKISIILSITSIIVTLIFVWMHFTK